MIVVSVFCEGEAPVRKPVSSMPAAGSFAGNEALKLFGGHIDCIELTDVGETRSYRDAVVEAEAGRGNLIRMLLEPDTADRDARKRKAKAARFLAQLGL